MSILKLGKKIALASDHAGFEMKEIIEGYLQAMNIPVTDFGTHSADSCDYPDYAHPMASAVENDVCYPGIALCGSGEGMAMTLNKHRGIRAALCWNSEVAMLSRQHNDANVLVLPARFIDATTAIHIIETFLNTSFEGGRHERRIAKIPL